MGHSTNRNKKVERKSVWSYGEAMDSRRVRGVTGVKFLTG